MLNELEEVGIPNTPEYLLYVDEDQKDGAFPNLDKAVTPKAGDKCIHASAMLPCGRGTAHGNAKACKHDNDGNTTGNQSDSPILDTHPYDIEFPDGESTSLSAYAVLKAMHAPCDMDANEYSMLEGSCCNKPA